jgi:Protein of unknown function (DUF2971)
MIRDISASAGEIPSPSVGSEPAHIYHYTSPSGLRSIIESASLWATDVWFMNDTVEATFGREAIEIYLRRKGSDSSADNQFCVVALEMPANINDSLARSDVLNSYIACLSGEGDQLSQWRAYGQGGGFSIGFDRLALEQLAAALTNPMNFTVRKVAYDRAEQETLLDAIYLPSFAALPSPVDQLDLRRAALGFVDQAMNLSPALKHPAFAEEKEYRLHIFLGSAAYTSSVLKFRDSPMGVTPYLKIPLCEPAKKHITVITKVIIGPQRHQPEAKRAIRQLFQVHGMPDVEITTSEIPLRA